MSVLTKNFFRISGLNQPFTYIETGTYQGKNLLAVIESGNYKSIHSIELSRDWFEFNNRLLHQFPEVYLHNGNSPDVLKVILQTVKNPVQFFLDAHYSGPGTAQGKMETPLLEELSVIMDSKLSGKIIVVIDDCRMLGKIGHMDRSKNYESFFSDWSDITEKEIRRIIGKDFIVLHNEMGIWTLGKSDQLILVNIGGVRAKILLALDVIISFLTFIVRVSGHLAQRVKPFVK
jgi:hypothetical protein